MTEIVNPRLGERVLDPACGTGGFLTCAIENIRKQDVHSVEDLKTFAGRNSSRSRSCSA